MSDGKLSTAGGNSEPAGLGLEGQAARTSAGDLLDVTVTVNGVRRSATVEARRLLSDFLRHDLGLTGTHVGCEHGVCGCCTVLLDGEPVRSCLMLTPTADGHAVTTVEGLAAADGTLGPVQRAFMECHGLQCGFCTPGFLTTVTALLTTNPDPSESEILEGISGNLCRCTGYQNIRAAVRRAAELMARAAPLANERGPVAGVSEEAGRRPAGSGGEGAP